MGIKGLLPGLKEHIIQPLQISKNSGNRLVVFSFLLFHGVSLGCFVFSPCLSSHPSSSFCKSLSLSLFFCHSMNAQPYDLMLVIRSSCFFSSKHDIISWWYQVIQRLTFWAWLHPDDELACTRFLSSTDYLDCNPIVVLWDSWRNPSFFCLGSLWVPWSWCLFDMRSWCIGSCSGQLMYCLQWQMSSQGSNMGCLSDLSNVYSRDSVGVFESQNDL